MATLNFKAQLLLSEARDLELMTRPATRLIGSIPDYAQVRALALKMKRDLQEIAAQARLSQIKRCAHDMVGEGHRQRCTKCGKQEINWAAGRVAL